MTRNETQTRREAELKRHLPLVEPIARHFAFSRPDLLDDLRQVGAIGLLRALERYDAGQGVPFEPFARTWIAGEMRHYLRDAVPMVRPPRELVELRGRVAAARAELSDEADGAAIAEATGLPLAKVLEVLALEENFQAASLDADEAGDRLVDGRYKSFQLAEDDRIMLAAAMARLRAVSREVIEFAYYEDLTQAEIAKRLGVSQMQVSRRLRGALGELWKVLNTKIV